MKAILSSIFQSIEALRRRPTRIQWVRFGISLALAVLIWGWVTELQDPYTTKTIRDVPIELADLPDNLQVVSTLPNVTVTIKGAESRVGPVQKADVTVDFDTNNIRGPGTYNVALMADAPNVNDSSVEPREMTIQVDERVSEIFTLNPQFTNTVDQTRTIGAIVPSVSQVTVSGPTSAVDRVADVILPVTIDTQTQSYDATYVPYAVDSAGQRIAEVDVLPDTILTRVELQTRGKALSVIPVVMGIPAEGFSIQQRRALPDTIVVDGPEEILDDLLFVNTVPVDVTDATQSISTRVGLADLPPGVTIIDPISEKIEVRVAIEDTTSSSQTLNDLPVEAIGLEPGFVAQFNPATVPIQVSASATILQSMTPEDISILVDVTGLALGTHRLAPQVTVPQGATWTGENLTVITVTIVAEGDSTPPGSTPESSPQP